MKNFDLDKIENRQLYEMPKEFYEKIQENVLEQTIAKNNIVALNPRTKLNWVFAAAASLAILFGGTYFFQNEDTNENKLLTSRQTKAENIEPKNTLVKNSEFNVVQNFAEPTENRNIVSPTKIDNRTEAFAKKPILAKTENKKPIKISKSEDQIDFLLENFTEEEMATLAKNSDNDVYLDLYN